MTPEAWWPRAVFYRVDPARFQDANADGRGDLQGLVQRLDYIQSLGVDAVLLDGDLGASTPGDLSDLVREASAHHLRVLATLQAGAGLGERDPLLRTVQGWLRDGLAGVWVPKPPALPPGDAGYRSLLEGLRDLLQSFPGERVLLSDATTMPLSLAPRPIRLSRRLDKGGSGLPRVGQLVTAAVLPVSSANVALLRSRLATAGEETPSGTAPLLRFAEPPRTGSLDAVGDGALLLGSRAAVILDFGAEIGLDTYPVQSGDAAPAPLMQWTPSNHTPDAVERAEAPSGIASGAEPQFGAYHPYIPPLRGLAPLAPSPGRVAVDANLPSALPDPNALPGFTAGSLPVVPVNGATLNVVTEDRDPRSLLNAYRQLIALHHDNATLRNGTESTFRRDEEDLVLWVRRAPAGSRSSANVVAAVNLSDKPVAVSLDSDLASLGMRPGAVRLLFTSAPGSVLGLTTERLTLPPHAVLLGEIVHTGGGRAEPPMRERRSGRRGGRRGRRVRR